MKEGNTWIYIPIHAYIKKQIIYHLSFQYFICAIFNFINNIFPTKFCNKFPIMNYQNNIKYFTILFICHIYG